MKHSTRSLVLVLLIGSACGGAQTPIARRSTTERPRIVVAVVLDQLASDALERYLPYLDGDGAIRRGIRVGAFHRHVVYEYASTYTAPGHAAIYTGAAPAVTGVVSNEVWDRARGRAVSIVDDAQHAVHGVEGAFASPAVLRVETVAEALERETEGRAIIASLSIKDRGAIFAGGRQPELVVWYDDDLPGFTTSTYYAGATPTWLEEWQAQHPIESILVPWEAEDPALLARVLGPDDAEGEGDWSGLGVTFPHDPRASSHPYSVLRATPRSSEHLLALAQAAVEHLDIGADDVPDLLALSVSSTDYVAHVFGPDSWEYLDNLVRSDRALAAFLDRLERERGPIAVLITSDHGGAPLPERVPGESGRLMPESLSRSLEAALDRALGDGTWVSAYVQPFVYLSDAARAPSVRDRAVAAAIEHLSTQREVALAADAREASGWRSDPDPVRRAVGLSVPDETDGDIFVVPQRGFIVDEAMPSGYGTSHGTPWEYDRTVPVIVWGACTSHVETDEPLPQARVAPTIAALFGVAPPSNAPRHALPGVACTR